MLQRCVALNIAFTFTIHTLPLLYLRAQIKIHVCKARNGGNPP